MAVSYQSIIDAIDQAILDWVDKPVSLTSASGKSVTYRTLSELTEARGSYASLLRTQQGNVGFGVANIKAGGAT